MASCCLRPSALASRSLARLPQGSDQRQKGAAAGRRPDVGSSWRVSAFWTGGEVGGCRVVAAAAAVAKEGEGELRRRRTHGASTTASRFAQ